MPKELDDWRAFETVGRLLERHRWEYLRTETGSHQFTVRKKWVAQERGRADADFGHVVR